MMTFIHKLFASAILLNMAIFLYFGYGFIGTTYLTFNDGIPALNQTHVFCAHMLAISGGSLLAIAAAWGIVAIWKGDWRP